MKKIVRLIIVVGLSFFTILPKSFATENQLSQFALKAGASVSLDWHKIVVAKQNGDNLFSDAFNIVRLMEADGNFKLVAVRKIALPATMALLNAMHKHSIKIGLVAGIIATLHTGYHGYTLYGIVNGDIKRARDVAGFHPAFNFGNVSDSFVPRFVSRLIMIPVDFVDFILGGDRNSEWPFWARNIRWTMMEAYHDGVVWFAFGAAVAAIAGGASHLLTDGFSDHNSLELFFEKL